VRQSLSLSRRLSSWTTWTTGVFEVFVFFVSAMCPGALHGNLAFKILRDVYGENYNYADVESEVIFPH
jgi:hypothetical protein